MRSQLVSPVGPSASWGTSSDPASSAAEPPCEEAAAPAALPRGERAPTRAGREAGRPAAAAWELTSELQRKELRGDLKHLKFKNL